MSIGDVPSFTPNQPCWHCHLFERMVYAGTAARCTVGGHVRIEAVPARGCSAWQREVGADDEPGPLAVLLDVSAIVARPSTR